MAPSAQWPECEDWPACWPPVPAGLACGATLGTRSGRCDRRHDEVTRLALDELEAHGLAGLSSPLSSDALAALNSIVIAGHFSVDDRPVVEAQRAGLECQRCRSCLRPCGRSR
jgi:hypothetical protein